MHLGIAVLFIGVAASSSFQHASELALSPGPVHARRRLHRPLRAPDGDDHAQVRRGPHRLDAQPRRRARRHQERAPRRHARPRARATTPPRNPPRGRSGSLIGGQPVSHVSMDAGVTRDVWSAIAPDIEAPALKRIVEASATRRSSPEEALVAIGYLARALPEEPAAGAVPLHRLAAGDVDLDRRPDRLRRRPDRDLARAEHRPPRASPRAPARARRAGSRAPEPRRAQRRRGRPDRPAARWCCSRWSSLVVSAPLRAARRAARGGAPAPGGGAAGGRRARERRRARASSRPRARPSTARSATPSSTTAPASSPRGLRERRRRAARGGARRSSTGWRRRGRPRPRPAQERRRRRRGSAPRVA